MDSRDLFFNTLPAYVGQHYHKWMFCGAAVARSPRVPFIDVDDSEDGKRPLFDCCSPMAYGFAVSTRLCIILAIYALYASWSFGIGMHVHHRRSTLRCMFCIVGVVKLQYVIHDRFRLRTSYITE